MEDIINSRLRWDPSKYIYIMKSHIHKRISYIKLNENAEGFCIFYCYTGVIYSEEHLRRGRRNGYHIAYYTNGEKASTGFYDNEEKVGKWYYWNENGSLRSEEVYE